LVEVDIETLLLTNVNFQNPIALLTMELRSRTCATTSTCRDLYYTAKEIKDRVPKIEDKNRGTDLEDKTMDRLDTNSEGNFDPESDEEDL
jgi:hypothetical protein